MRIILLKDVKGVGRKFDAKDVKDGYARNFLLPNNLAEPATPQALRRLMEEKTKHEAEREKRITRFKTQAQELEKSVLNFKLSTGEKGEVFGSVTAKDIEQELKERGMADVRIHLEKPLKSLGEHEVQIDLGEGIKVKIKVLLENQ